MAIKIKKRYDIDGHIVYASENEMTFCDYCNKPVLYGMVGNNECCHVHEECFEKYMDKTYGKNKWKPTENGEEEELGSYYLYTIDGNKWYPTGIFYTEWWDDYDADWNYNKDRNNKYDFIVHRNKKCFGMIEDIVVYTGIDNKGNEMFKTFKHPTEDILKWEVNN